MAKVASRHTRTVILTVRLGSGAGIKQEEHVTMVPRRGCCLLGYLRGQREIAIHMNNRGPVQCPLLAVWLTIRLEYVEKALDFCHVYIDMLGSNMNSLYAVGFQNE